MSRFKIKKLPPIRLVDLLRKRRTNLKNFLTSYGIVSYSTLLQKCNNMGVSPPSETEFKQTLGSAAEVSSPQEGIVVLDPPKLLKELTGEKILVDETPELQKLETKPSIDESHHVVFESKFTPAEINEPAEPTEPELTEQAEPVESTETSELSVVTETQKTYKKKKSQMIKIEV